ncbi:folate family ECF transporter S component [Eubacteriales bacterium OttesenSCG-928-K08]|nr:folate family ECF transporter S component [Eubacteriales bacterium OttesenSCG-928-K08]
MMRVQFQTKRIVVCGLLCAIGVVLGGLLSVPAFPLGVYSVKISLANLPVILSGVLFGPLYGAIVGGLTDFLQALLFPKGAFVPWFTLVSTLFGLIPGLFFRHGEKVTFPRLAAAVVSGQVVGSLLLNTLLMVWLYGLPFWSLLPTRLINQSIMIPLFVVIIYLLVPLLERHGVRFPRQEH